MNATRLTAELLKKLQNDIVLKDLKVTVANYIPVGVPPPFIVLSTLEYQTGIGSKTLSASVQMTLTSAYRGEYELESIVQACFKNLIQNNFRVFDEKFNAQGKLLDRQKQFDIIHQTRSETLKIIYFMSAI